MTTIYVDNAATTKTSRTAIEAMLPYMDKIYGNPSSLHSVGQAAADALRKAREEAAEVLGCEPNEITFTSGGSEADNQALVSAAAIGARKGKKHIISTAFEHHAILHTLKKLEKEGFEVTLLDVHENGMVSAQQVADAIREDTCLVSVMYANNEIGSIQPIAEIGAVCKEKGVIFHTDAVQAVGHVHINVKEENIDMLSLSAHKFHGPKGVGLLYARKGVRLTNIIEGGAQERGKRGGTENVPGIAGLGEAVKEIYTDFNEKMERLYGLREYFVEEIEKIEGTTVNGPKGREGAPHIVSVSFAGVRSEVLLHSLEDKGIYVSSGSACASNHPAVSETLKAIHVKKELLDSTIRFSFSEFTTKEELDYTLEALRTLLPMLRRFTRR